MNSLFKIIFILTISSCVFIRAENKKVLTKWRVAEAVNGNKKVIYRFLDEKPASWKKLPLAEEVSISWKYEGGMPAKGIHEKMKKLEDALLKLTADGSTELVLVMTGNGMREWCFYTKSYPEFMKGLNKVLAGHTRYPIKIEHSKDPDWKYWHSFVDQIKKKDKSVRDKK